MFWRCPMPNLAISPHWEGGCHWKEKSGPIGRQVGCCCFLMYERHWKALVYNWWGLLPSRGVVIAMNLALFIFVKLFLLKYLKWMLIWTSNQMKDQPVRPSYQELLRLWVATWLYERTTFCLMRSCWWGVGPRCFTWNVPFETAGFDVYRVDCSIV